MILGVLSCDSETRIKSINGGFEADIPMIWLGKL